jgi:bifunctional DNase/RNase
MTGDQQRWFFRRNSDGQERMNIQPMRQTSSTDEDAAVVRQMEIVGVRVEMATNNPIVLLKETEGDRYLPIWIGPNEATAIAFAQKGLVPQRPLTHDLIRDIFEVLEIRLAAARITELRDGIFISSLRFADGRQVIARPSDSIALAQRTGAPIQVAEEILEVAGVTIPDGLEDPEQEAGSK